MEGSEGAIVLDAGAVIGLSRHNNKLRARVLAARADGAELRVPMVVVAETVRGNGPRDAPVNIVLAQTAPQHPLTERIARHAGQLLAEAGSSATIDALVAAEAIECAPSVILTSDPRDLRALLANEPGVVVEQI